MQTSWRAALVLVVVLSTVALAADKPIDRPANSLADQEQNDGWKLLFDGKTLDSWRVFKQRDASGWTVEDGTIVLEKPGSGDLMTKEKYGNFEFSLEAKCAGGNNSGIIYRVTEEGANTYNSGPELQVMDLDSNATLSKAGGGSLYDMFAPTANSFKPANQWNTYKVVANGKHLEHWVNDTKVVGCDIGSDDWTARLAVSKWKNEKLFASQSAGHIALQSFRGKLQFRNVKIRVLPPPPERKP